MSVVMKSSMTAKVSARRSVSAKAMAGNWKPGAPAPAWLKDADIPGNFGFDPLELGKDEKTLLRFREAEVIHCRWAMLGIAGALGAEVMGYGTWTEAPLAAIQGKPSTYMGMEVPFDLGTLVGVEILMFAIAEGMRGQNQGNKIYPGGAFDPMGMSKDSATFEKRKLQEIKNGRLAMMACAGLLAQDAAGCGSPLEALGAHLSAPYTNNFATNGISLPF